MNHGPLFKVNLITGEANYQQPPSYAPEEIHAAYINFEDRLDRQTWQHIDRLIEEHGPLCANGLYKTNLHSPSMSYRLHEALAILITQLNLHDPR